MRARGVVRTDRAKDLRYRSLSRRTRAIYSSQWSHGGSVLELIPSPALTIPVGVLLVLVLLLAVALVVAARKRRRAIERALDQINGLDGHLDAGNVGSVADAVPKGHFYNQWCEFRESFAEIDGQFFNTISADAFFKDEASLQEVRFLVHFPVIHILPGTATGIGIFGTFFGVALGLGELALHSNTSQEVVKHLPPVIGNLASAFWTSIGGIFIALVITFLARHSETKFLEIVHSLREALDGRVPRLTPDRLLRSMGNRS